MLSIGWLDIFLLKGGYLHPTYIKRNKEGEIKLEKGAIIAKRHLHCQPKEAERLEINHNQELSIIVPGKRSGVLSHVQVRVDPSFRLAIHLDTDEANALDIKPGDFGAILKKWIF